MLYRSSGRNRTFGPAIKYNSVYIYIYIYRHLGYSNGLFFTSDVYCTCIRCEMFRLRRAMFLGLIENHVVKEVTVDISKNEVIILLVPFTRI
jgi:hypothetical protein